MPDIPFYFFNRKRLGSLPPNAKAMGWKSPADVYAHSRLVVVPSRWFEAYGRVVDEALALGIPVVMSDRPGLKEASKGRANIIANLDDIGAWTKAVRQVWEQEEQSHASCI